MNAIKAFILFILLFLTVSSRFSVTQGLGMNESCIYPLDRAKWIRSLHFNNKSFSLNIEVNDRPSNWIINYIFEILLRERYGYRNINFIYAPWDSSANAIGRLNCEKSKKDCSLPPPIHVNLEVWLRTGEQVSDYAPPHRVSSNGPLGPITRWGLYANEELWNHYSPLNRDPTLSSASSFYESLAGSGGNGMLYYDRPSMLNAYHRLLSDDGVTRMELRSEHLPTQSLWNITSNTISGPGDRLPVLLNWYPNALTVKSRLVRLGLPDCLAFSARVPENVTVSATCDFEVNELVKVSWARLAESAPLIKQLLDRFSIKQADYIDLLRRVTPDILNYSEAVKNGKERQFRVRYRELACRWLRMRTDVWREWTEGWNVKKEIIIGGMFTFTGTEEFNDLTPNAFHAVDQLNGDEAYLGNSEFAIKLQIRNLTCSQNVVLNDFFNFLTVNPNNESILGVVLALCPDAIEATVRLANLRRVLVISPTVESASFLWQKHYKFFFRTIPSAYTASFIFSRLFQEWQWKRVAIFRKDDHYFYREGFMAYNVTLVDDFEVKESMLTYAVAQKNVMTIKQRNVRIIIVDHSAAATAKILCAAFHLNMLAEKGYVWFLSPWIDKTAWDSPEIIPPECSVYDLKLMHKFSFSLSQAVAYSAPSIGYNRSLENFGKPVRQSEQRKLYEQCAYESVLVLGSAVARLLRENPSALSILNHPKMAERLRTLVSETQMEYISHGGYKDKNAVSFFTNPVDVLGETLVYRLGTTPQKPMVQPQIPIPRMGHGEEEDRNDPHNSGQKIHQLSFDAHNDRLLNSWVVKQYKDIGTTVPIILWSLGDKENATKGNETSQLPPTFPIRASSGGGGDDNDNVPDDNRNDVIAFKLFVDNLTKRYFDSPSWIAGGNGPPSDGSITEADCTFPFLSRWFGVTCVVGNWIFAMGILVIIAIPVVAIVLAYFRRRLREAEKLTRKPYEELCALLADVNIPLSDIVINRRIGDGAFGLVYGGEAKSAGRWEAVAVKMNTNRTTYEAKVEFLSEAKLMRDLRHKNVVRLVGVCMDRPQDEIYLIMELMLLGDLKKYLLERRLTAQRCPDDEDICPATLTRMALDIAEGLAYLHSKQLIHRDIACRNCLVGPDHVVKIGDFGLTREAAGGSPYGYYRFTRNVELPIRWMPPEAVQFGIFSVKSDLWSYGIVLYEIITFGMFPYADLGDVEVVERVKRSEFSITQILPPAANGTVVWRLIVSCCQYLWQHRPESMLQVIEEIRANENCIRPYLTDAPPTLETTAIPFLPGPGACIMPEPPPVSQPAFSAPMGARAWVGGTPFMNPSVPLTEPPSASEGPQRHATTTTANSRSSGGAGGGGSQNVSYSSSSAASLATTSNSGTSSWAGQLGGVGQTPTRQRAPPPPPPPASVYAPPGHPEYQPLEEYNPLLNPTNRSMSLEFLQKSDFHVHTPLSSKHGYDEGDDSEGVDAAIDYTNEEVFAEIHQKQYTPCSQQKVIALTPGSTSGTRRGGNLFSRTLAVALDLRGGKSHSRRSVGLPSFRRGDQPSSMRLRLLSSLRQHHHQQLTQNIFQQQQQTSVAPCSSSSPSFRNELTVKSLPQVTTSSSSTTKVPPPRRGACSSAGDAHYLARPSRPAGPTSVSSASVTQNGGLVTTASPSGGSTPSAFTYHYHHHHHHHHPNHDSLV